MTKVSAQNPEHDRMLQFAKPKWPILAIVVSLVFLSVGTGDPHQDESCTAAAADDDQASPEIEADSNGAVSLEEARGRAQLLHETIHTTLQVMHREFYREDEGLPIPSRTLHAVFDRLEKGWNVKIDWLAVNAQAMDIDHKPRDEFEKSAVLALTKGAQEFERVDGDRYRHVGAIRLASECLKCHLPDRRSTEDRAAGLVISMPVRRD